MPEPAARPGERTLSGNQAWLEVFADLFGPVAFEQVGGRLAHGSVIEATLWRLRLSRIALSAHRIEVSPGLARPGTHPYNHVRFQTAGTTFFEQDGKTITIEPGDCLAYNPSRPHILWSRERTAFDAVTLPIELVKLQSVPVELLWVRKIARGEVDDVGAVAHAMLRMLLDERPALPLSAAASVAQAQIDLLNAIFSRDIAGPTGLSRAAMTRFRAKAYIADHLREAETTVASISAAIGCTPRYLQIIFAVEGDSPSRYLWRERLVRCRDELESPASETRSITDIAFSWGFSSASHFTHAYRSAFGTTPSTDRRWRGDPGERAIGPPGS